MGLLPLLLRIAAGEPAPTVERDFATLEGWEEKAPHGSIRAVRHRGGEDGWVAELRFPGDPALGARDRVGPVKWPVELGTVERVHFGTYRARLQLASCSPDEELVSAFFTYANDGEDHDGNGIMDNPEIDVEVLCGEPHLLWLTVWTDYQRREGRVSCRKQTRVIDMRDGTYRQSPPGSRCASRLVPAGKLAGIAVPDFPGDRFHELGFDWRPDGVTYFIVLDGREITLWELDDPDLVPQRPGQLRLQVWHSSSHWDAGGLADYPARDGVMRVDWVRYWAR